MKTRLRWAGAALAVGLCAATAHFVALGHDAAAGEPAAAAGGQIAPASPAPRAINRELTRGGKPPAESDTLVLHYADDPDTVNPLTANDVTSENLQRLVYEGLADRKYSNPDEWEPSLAESWTYDPATMEYTIHLRKGVKWQPITLPGEKHKVLPATEFTARDVKFTFDCILNKYIEATHLRSYFEDPKADEAHRSKIKVSLVPHDKYTIRIQWLKPYFMADDLTLGQTIIPRHVFSVDKDGDPISLDFSSKEFAKGFNEHWANKQMCGTGPMVFKEWIKEQKVTLERNPDYWGEPFYFSRIVYRHISNPNTAVQQMLQNQLDFSAIPDKDHYFENLKHKNVVNGKVVLKEFDYPGYRYLGYNEKREFFKDKRVRTAIGHAVPVDEIIATIFHGLATRITGPFLPSSPANEASLPPLDFNLEKAGAMLDDAGWKMAEGESVRSKTVDGVKVDASFDLMIYSDAPSFQSIATIIKENCRKIGVRVRVSPAKWASMLQKLRQKEFDAVILGWAMSWKDDPFQIWDSSQAELPDSSNSIGYANPEVDKLIARLRVTMDPAKQTEIYHEIHRILYADQPYTFLFSEKQTCGYDGRLQNIHFYKIRPCIDLREWYSTTPRALGE